MKNHNLLDNSRFYILISSVLLSLIVASWLRLEITSDRLFYIRVQQVFGLLCLAYWYMALAISPIGYVIGKHRIAHIEFARRAIGVSAFYFALLHGIVALFGQLGGPGQLQYLPELFKWSLFFGLVSFLVLMVMAATSFDVVVKFMSYKKWKWLHRLVYLALVLVMVHIWSVGTHLAYARVQNLALLALVVLFGLESFRISKNLAKKVSDLKVGYYFWTVFVSLWISMTAAAMLIPAAVENYHSRHSDHHERASGASK